MAKGFYPTHDIITSYGYYVTWRDNTMRKGYGMSKRFDKLDDAIEFAEAQLYDYDIVYEEKRIMFHSRGGEPDARY